MTARMEGAREVVVVTGAGAGLGLAIVNAFARRGASIGLVSRDVDRLAAAQHAVEVAGGKALVLPVDVADADQVEDAAAKVEDAFGPIDVWVNNAMASVFSRFTEMTPAEFRRVNEVTYFGYVYGTMAALKRMLPRDRGAVVQVGSALAYRSIPLQAAYCGAKHGIVGFTDSIRTELLHDRSRVRITAVHMPALNTPQFSWTKSRMQRKAQPVPPIFQPEVGAEAVYWAAHHCPRELLVGWITVKALLGQKFVPGYADRRLARDGFEAQQYDGPEDPNRPHNLWEPVPGPFGAHGDFDSRAKEHSAELWLRIHRTAVLLVILAAASAVLLLLAL